MYKRPLCCAINSSGSLYQDRLRKVAARRTGEGVESTHGWRCETNSICDTLKAIIVIPTDALVEHFRD
ncbi:hypothetical protein J6590_013295 [Homalodisca vitripennis]|nr:hypothetical protein J6590_013295 [Homalodisca vitripennis]